MRSNTRGVYKGDDDDLLVAEHQEIDRIATAIEARRIELGKTSGFERLYARVTKLYFGGMARHLAELQTMLRPGAQLAYVVGDQASYLRVMIRTGELLADIAKSLGYELVGIDLFRTRLATATREQLREEVVVLRWPGPARRQQEPGNVGSGIVPPVVRGGRQRLEDQTDAPAARISPPRRVAQSGVVVGPGCDMKEKEGSLLTREVADAALAPAHRDHDGRAPLRRSRAGRRA